MNITVQQGGIQTIAADAIIVNLFQEVTEPAGATGAVNQALNGAIGELIAGGDLRGKLRNLRALSAPAPGERDVARAVGVQAELE